MRQSLKDFNPRRASVLQQAADARKKQSAAVVDEYAVNGVNLRRSYWRLLRRVAEARVDERGRGRPSVSKVIERLIDESRPALEKELR
jgi:hypothetical protein